MSGPRKMPRLPEKANQLKLRAWVRGVLCSAIMVRMVTMVPEKTPAAQRKRIICQRARARPNMLVARLIPTSEETRTGLRPTRSERRLQNSITTIWVRLKSDSIRPL